MPATTRAAERLGSQEVADRLDKGSRSPRKTSPAKSNASSERPIRRQLRNTKIIAEGDAASAENADYPSSENGSVETDPEKRSPVSENGKTRGRSKKKRTFNDLSEDPSDAKDPAAGSKQPRKRSRSEDAEQVVKAEPPRGLSEDPEADEFPGEETMTEAEHHKSSMVEPTSGEEAIAEAEPPLESESLKDSELVAEEEPMTEAEPAAEAEPSTGIEPTSEADPTAGAETAEPITDEVSNTDEVKKSAPLERPNTPPSTESIETKKPSETGLTSPHNKRNREQFVNGQIGGTPTKAGDLTDATEASSRAAVFTKESTPSMQEPEKKKPRDELKVISDADKEAPAAKVPFGSGFGNTSITSPFASIPSKTPKSPEPQQPQTSSTAFASSGFASFASTTQSPFGSAPPSTALDKKGDKLAEGAKSDAAPSFASLSGSKSPFASTTTPSAFGAAQGFGSTSAFGGLSNGFGGIGGNAPLTNWGTNGASGIIGTSSKPAKPFGAPKVKDDEGEEENDEIPEPQDQQIGSADETKKDPRFYEQLVESGENNEITIFSSRAKLYVNDDKQWKERAVGSIKINEAQFTDDPDDPEARQGTTARFIMRADGSHKVMLNSPITKDINLRDPTGGEPKGKNALFMGFDNGKLKLMQLKMKDPTQTKDLYNVVKNFLAYNESSPAPSTT